jgi:hypothetical protein
MRTNAMKRGKYREDVVQNPVILCAIHHCQNPLKPTGYKEFHLLEYNAV